MDGHERSLKLGVTVLGVDRFDADGAEATVLRLYEEWRQGLKADTVAADAAMAMLRGAPTGAVSGAHAPALGAPPGRPRLVKRPSPEASSPFAAPHSDGADV